MKCQESLAGSNEGGLVDSNEDIMLKGTGLSHEDRIDLEKLNEFTKSIGFLYGERFSITEASWAKNNVALTRLRLSSDLKTESASYVLHPCIIDACLQMKICLDMCRSISDSSSKPPVPSIPIGKLSNDLLLILRLFMLITDILLNNFNLSSGKLVRNFSAIYHFISFRC